MGVTLISQSEHSVYYNWTAWEKLLGLARAYGWIPEGTEPSLEYEDLCREEPDRERWPGTYDSNDGQWVKRSDARKLYNALETAMEDYTQHEKHKLDMKNLSDIQKEKIISLSNNRMFRTIVAEFIWFCSKGGFCIY